MHTCTKCNKNTARIILDNQYYCLDCYQYTYLEPGEGDSWFVNKDFTICEDSGVRRHFQVSFVSLEKGTRWDAKEIDGHYHFACVFEEIARIIDPSEKDEYLWDLILVWKRKYLLGESFKYSICKI